jgi:hypothetical protein
MSATATATAPARPIIKDKTGWEIALLEHRRTLFERVVQNFPEVLKTKRTDVEIWRARLTTAVDSLPPAAVRQPKKGQVAAL